MKKLSVVCGLLALVIVSVAVALPAAVGSPDDWAGVRVETARYHSLDQAVAAGYVQDSPCEELPGAGGMGQHHVNFALIGDPAIDPLKPEILLYAPKANGKLELIGVEYFKVDADQNLATDDDRPSVLGQPLDGPMPGHTPTMPIHYDLHVWLWQDNPSGFFAPWNPSVDCPAP